jgi:hypothetical protein
MMWPAITALMDSGEFIPDPPFPMGAVDEAAPEPDPEPDPEPEPEPEENTEDPA